MNIPNHYNLICLIAIIILIVGIIKINLGNFFQNIRHLYFLFHINLKMVNKETIFILFVYLGLIIFFIIKVYRKYLKYCILLERN